MLITSVAEFEKIKGKEGVDVGDTMAAIVLDGVDVGETLATGRGVFVCVDMEVTLALARNAPKDGEGVALKKNAPNDGVVEEVTLGTVPKVGDAEGSPAVHATLHTAEPVMN